MRNYAYSRERWDYGAEEAAGFKTLQGQIINMRRVSAQHSVPQLSSGRRHFVAYSRPAPKLVIITI